MHKYKARVKHDKGIVNIFTHAQSSEDVKRIILISEKCPERSILSISIEITRKEKERLKAQFPTMPLRFMRNGEVHAKRGNVYRNNWALLLTARQVEDTIILWRNDAESK